MNRKQAKIPVKRTLQLEKISKENKYQKNELTPTKQSQANTELFSPVTGTCELNESFVPDRDVNDVKKDNDAVASQKIQPTSRGHSKPSQEKDFMVLHSKVKNLAAAFKEEREKLKTLKALEGSRELENVIGFWDTSNDLETELCKNRELMVQIQKRQSE
ncbi:centromere protein R [Latimeria chalumnae]|uniref:Integrin subunit beta 3 binding protein n=1 Tax=Latimeria chalumnae TaxID=7897 RepID=M3XKB0_LATCH|nr:PREDICTED: centromere protein R [Latimeria chalumnae]|eukprot:XP_005996900.1 PREDICTED: centromere protein R [Latimeria chalumnae]